MSATKPTSSTAPNPPRPAAADWPRLAGLGVVMLLGFGGILYFLHTRAGAGVRPEEPSSGASIESVVESSRSQIRECWDRALLTKARGAPSEARVDATIVVSSSGTIDRVTTTGDPEGYPNLAICVEAKIRRWQFPKGSQSTTVDVPFMFGGP